MIDEFVFSVVWVYRFLLNDEFDFDLDSWFIKSWFYLCAICFVVFSSRLKILQCKFQRIVWLSGWFDIIVVFISWWDTLRTVLLTLKNKFQLVSYAFSPSVDIMWWILLTPFKISIDWSFHIIINFVIFFFFLILCLKKNKFFFI